MSTIDDAVSTAVGDITATARAAAQDVADAATAFYDTQITELQAVVTSKSTQVEQLTSALAAATAAENADEAKVAAVTEQLATANSQLAQVQADFDAYKKSHPDTTPPPPPPPTTALMFGASMHGVDTSSLTAAIKHSLGAHRTYWQGSDSPATVVAQVTKDLSTKTVPFISTKLPASWGDVAAGKQDAWAKALLAALGKVNGTVYLCLHHEPVDNVGAAGSGMTQADYLAMYRHVFPMVPANVKLGAIIQSAPFDGAGGDITVWYDKTCMHFAGIDCYNHWDTNKADNTWRTPQQVMVCIDQLAKVGLPTFIMEWGVRTDPRTPGKAAQWMKDFVALAIAKKVAGLSYFSSDQNVNDGGIHPWTLADERLAAFAEINAAHLPA